MSRFTVNSALCACVWAAPLAAWAAPGSSTAAPARPVAQVLQEADSAFDGLDFVQALTLANRALQDPAITDAERVRAYALTAASHAIVGDVVAAERPYRLLLRLRPDFDLPRDTAPKILAVFRKVQAEEREIRQAVADAQRRELVQSIQLTVDAPPRHTGGRPLTVMVRAVDPREGIAAAVMRYRLHPEDAYTSLPLKPVTGGFATTFTPAQTATDRPLRWQYHVVAVDQRGEALMSVGSEADPRVLEMAAGQVPGLPLYRQRTFWAGLMSVSVASALPLLLLLGSGVTAAALGVPTAFLLIRGDGVPQTTAGTHRVQGS